MSKSFQDELREIIEDIQDQGVYELEGVSKETQDEAISQLNTLIKDCLPKENTSELKNGAFISGYNQAIKDTIKNLGVSDE